MEGGGGGVGGGRGGGVGGGGVGGEYSNLKMTQCDKIIFLKGIEISLARGETFTNEPSSKMPVTFRLPL